MDRGIPFEAWTVGRRLATRGRTVSEADIAAYVNLVGYTESLFQDMAYARAKGHDRRLAPGLLTCGLADALIVQTGALERYAVALLGIDGMAARAPVYAGDTIRVEVEVIEARPSRSRPDRGVVATRQRVVNQEGEVVLEYDVKRMILRSDSPEAA